MFIGLVAALAVFIAACNADVSADPIAARRHLEAGALLHVRGRLSEAIAEYDRAIALYQNDHEAFFNRGLAESEMRRFGEAISDFDAALRLAPTFAEAHYQRANAYDDIGQHERALVDYDAALDLAPRDTRLSFVRRDRAIAEFKLDRQRRLTDGVGDRNLTNPKGYLERCLYYTGQGLAQRALEDCHAAVRMDPADSRTFFARGNAYAEAGEFRRAILDYDSAIRLGEAGPHPYYNRGISRAQVGRQIEAIQDFNRTLRIDPGYANAYGARAVSFTFLGRRGAAERDFQRAVELGVDEEDLKAEINGVQRVLELRARDGRGD